MFRKIGFIIGLAVWGIGMSSCGYRSICEAQIIVKQADSLWRAGQMYGREAGDSTTLAQAYETLGRLSPFIFHLSSSYAHACYHYGRLLRERENPAAAMECFINATHTRTRDYHILGRVYSNMGSICHIAGDFQLSYEMYEQSAEMFLSNGDTLLYYYDLNNMAYEMAESGQKDRAYIILNKIEKECSCHSISVKMLETKANACKQVQQYDSTIYYAQKLYYIGVHEPTTFILLAQAYSFKGMQDSATCYAEKVLTCRASLSDLNNALYILTNDDMSKSLDAVRQAAAERSDTQKLIEVRKGNLAQAVQLLEQDLHCEPDFRWLYAIIATSITFIMCIVIYIYRKRQKHKLLSQKIDELEQATFTIQEKHNELTESYHTHHLRIEDEINNRCSMLQSNYTIKKNLAWKNYVKMCNIVDKQFYLLASKLQDKHSLKETEVRICILTLLNCGNRQMSELLYKSRTSIGTLKRRVANKLGTTSRCLRQYLIENECIN